MDMAILHWIQENIVADWLTPLMRCITFFGEYGAGWILLALGLLIPKKTRWLGLSVGAALILGLLLGEFGIKKLICRPRPFHVEEITLLIPAPHGFSCPSGHTTSSFAAATSVFLQNKKWGAVALVMAGLVACSRMYFFVHYLTDVLIGIALGIGCALAARWIIGKIRAAVSRKEGNEWKSV